jgi:hypothetical protein
MFLCSYTATVLNKKIDQTGGKGDLNNAHVPTVLKKTWLGVVQHGYICRSQKCVEKPDPCVPNPCGPGAVCILQVGTLLRKRLFFKEPLYMSEFLKPFLLVPGFRYYLFAQGHKVGCFSNI